MRRRRDIAGPGLRALGAGVVLAALALAPSGAGAACFEIPQHFAHQTLASFTEFNKSRKGSLLVMMSEADPVGTAFLIDARSGLVATAAHLLSQIAGLGKDNAAIDKLRQLLSGPDAGDHHRKLLRLVSARKGSRLDVKVTFEEVIVHGTRDLAVARLAAADRAHFEDESPFEIAFHAERMPPTAQFGYPRLADIKEAVARNSGFEPIWYSGSAVQASNKRFKIGQPAVPGDSGGPVILLDGLTFGLVHSNHFESQMNAESVPASLEDADFLRKLFLLRTVDIIEVFGKIFESGSHNWERALNPSSRTSQITNLDIAHLSEALVAQRDVAKKWAHFLRCFVAETARQRLGPVDALNRQLAGLGPPADPAADALRQARVTKELMGLVSREVAFAMAGDAAQLLSQALGTRLTRSSTAKAIACRIGSGTGSDITTRLFAGIGLKNFEPAAKPNPVTCFFAPSDDQASALTLEYFELQSARYKLAAGAGYALPADLQLFSATASAAPLIATYLADDNLIKGKAFERLGDLQVGSGNTENAASSFATAYDAFVKTGSFVDKKRIESKFEYAGFKGLQGADGPKSITAVARTSPADLQSILKNPLSLHLGGVQ